MNLKGFFAVFLCVLSVSAIFTVVAVAPSTVERCDLEEFASAVHNNYLTTNGAELTGELAGDPTGGWP